MGDVEVHSNFTITEKKTKKVKKTTKRRESNDQGQEVTITEIERTNGTQGYVVAFLVEEKQNFWTCIDSLGFNLEDQVQGSKQFIFLLYYVKRSIQIHLLWAEEEKEENMPSHTPFFNQR